MEFNVTHDITSEWAACRVAEISARATRCRYAADFKEAAECEQDADAFRVLSDMLRMNMSAALPQSLSPPLAPAFWLVWREGGRFAENIPECRHFEIAAANAEAERLAKKHPGVRFFVVPVRDYALAAIMPVAWGSVTRDDIEVEVPF